MFGGVRDGEVNPVGARLLEQIARPPVQHDRGRARSITPHLHVLPADAVRPPDPQSFERRFFGREARGVVLRGDRGSAAFAVLALARGEDSRGEARRARDGFTNAPDFDNVRSDGNDHE